MLVVICLDELLRLDLGFGFGCYCDFELGGALISGFVVCVCLWGLFSVNGLVCDFWVICTCFGLGIWC